MFFSFLLPRMALILCPRNIAMLKKKAANFTTLFKEGRKAAESWKGSVFNSSQENSTCRVRDDIKTLKCCSVVVVLILRVSGN